MTLNRAALQSKFLQKLVHSSELGFQVLSDAQLLASIAETLRHQQPNQDIWIFAYGSLIWNPILKFVERRTVTVEGWHRQFCLWTPLGRGTPEKPGLLLGLKSGGNCSGVAYRIAAEDIPNELLLLWRREMVVDSYVPRWVKISDGIEQTHAIAFTINLDHPLYADNLPAETVIEHIATARGTIGSCAEYLAQTVSGLLSIGIEDQHLIHLYDQVKARLKQIDSQS